MVNETEFYSIKEFAKILGLHPNTVRRNVKNGRISALRLGSGKKCVYRISRTEISRIALFDLQEMIEKIIDQRQKENKDVI